MSHLEKFVQDMGVFLINHSISCDFFSATALFTLDYVKLYSLYVCLLGLPVHRISGFDCMGRLYRFSLQC